MLTALPATAANPALERQFTQTVRPFLTQYCIGCHSGQTPAGSLDLKSYDSTDAIVRDYSRWATVHDKLTARQMPPKPVPPPPDDVRKKVVDWIDAVRADESRKHAGDPGPVLARRLSNSEYNYTVRDLTGQDLRPTREFPVDPANPMGFDNSGESLTMSSALLKKYLQAARDVGDHMVLTPQGIDFAPYPMLSETDRDKYPIQRIVNFYFSQPTDFADYFEAAWRYKYRAALGKPNATLAAVAAESKVSANYLPLVWQLIEEPSEKAKQEVGPIARLQAMWRALPAPAANQPDVVRAKCVEMRDFVVKIRKHTAMQFFAPLVKGLPAGSQPLLNWKLRQFAEHRRDSDPRVLRDENSPPEVMPEIPRYPGLHAEAAPRWAALSAKARFGDRDLVVPAAERKRYEASFARFASVFPDTFYVTERGRYFPDDSEDKGRLLSAGYHSVMGFFRDDTPLMELILDDKGRKELNGLWEEFDYMADFTARTFVQYFFNQSGEVLGHGAESGNPRPPDHEVTDEPVIMGLKAAYLAKAAADPKNDPAAAQAIREHFDSVNATLRGLEKTRAAAESKHLDAVLEFAARAYRRPLTKAERDDMIAFYHKAREKGQLSHEEAIRDSIVSVLMSPDFLYRIDLLDARNDRRGQSVLQPVAVSSGAAAVHPISDYALASRLSYFLWSSMPDRELMRHAALGDLHRPDVLLAQTARMLKDERVVGFVTEFAGNWLDFRRFENYNSVDREHFPTFTNDLREAMFQEPIRFMEDVVRNNRSVLDMLYGKYTFVNPVLAKHYGMPEMKGDKDTWVRVDDASNYQRGGLLPMSVFLTNTSPGQRTSPVKRGYWIVHRLLGETIPPPPPVVPELPHDESKTDLSLRELLAQHRANPVCAGCHARFDVFGLALEGYGPVGESRTKDLAGRPIDASATLPGGVQENGFEGVQRFIRDHRQKDFVEGLSRKLVAYALGRSLQLSDETLVERMDARLAARQYRFNALVETIVTSPQFLNKRMPAPAAAPVAQYSPGSKSLALLRKGE
ncbi:MAG: DUF1592 domain-containing protein [Acidobacteriota bacterium]|nr:DUF1592 domain-containing protein [Acidobacteriota bacterium]